MLSPREIGGCIDRAVMNLASVIGTDKTKETIGLLQTHEHLSQMIHSICLEVAFTATNQGVNMADSAKSMLTLPEGKPVMMRDAQSKSLVIAVPKLGKYYIVGTDQEMEGFRPDTWYDIDLFEDDRTEEEKAAEPVIERLPT